MHSALRTCYTLLLALCPMQTTPSTALGMVSAKHQSTGYSDNSTETEEDTKQHQSQFIQTEIVENLLGMWQSNFSNMNLYSAHALVSHHTLCDNSVLPIGTGEIKQETTPGKQARVKPLKSNRTKEEVEAIIKGTFNYKYNKLKNEPFKGSEGRDKYVANLKKLLEEYPEESQGANVMMLIGDIYQRSNPTQKYYHNYQEALKWLLKAAEHSEPGSRIWIKSQMAAAQLLRNQMGEERAPQSLQILEKMLKDIKKNSYDHAMILEQLVSISLELSETEKAEEYCRSLLAITTEDLTKNELSSVASLKELSAKHLMYNWAYSAKLTKDQKTQKITEFSNEHSSNIAGVQKHSTQSIKIANNIRVNPHKDAVALQSLQKHYQVLEKKASTESQSGRQSLLILINGVAFVLVLAFIIARRFRR